MISYVFCLAVLEYTADGKHRDAILEELGLESESKSLGCLALGADKMDEPGDENELLKEDVTSFRSVAARSNYLGMDRPDIQYGVKELWATMSRPTQRSWRQLKQLVRYVVGAAFLARPIPQCDEVEPFTTMSRDVRE